MAGRGPAGRLIVQAYYDALEWSLRESPRPVALADFHYSALGEAMIPFLYVGMQEGSERREVTVIGGGLAGMAASLNLARAGYRVTCIEPATVAEQPVGESLDWSSPALLEALGLPMDGLIRDNVATYKRHVTVKLRDGATRHYEPGAWLARSPYNIELRTLHVDRLPLDRSLREMVLQSGVEMASDRVVDVETAGRKVSAVKTASGRRLSSDWFIDASGTTALFARIFRLPVYQYGPKKVAMWTYLNVSQASEGTTLYMDGQPPYMQWTWEIPIHLNVISVGCVAAGEAIRQKRQQGLTVEDIVREHLARFPRFSGLLPAPGALSPHVTSFQCRTHGRLAGPNWLIVGEAASLVDPMTSNGVTAALRHAREACAVIVSSGRGKRLPFVAGAMYSKRIVDLGRFFNCGIEKTIYDSAVRNRVGVLRAGRIYTVPAWVFNAVYSRTRPEGVAGTLLFGFVLNLFRTAAIVLSAVCLRLGARQEAG
jgi:flavin-dependent dehydrogenase